MSSKTELQQIAAAGDDLVAAIKNANWGTIRHATMHMQDAIAVWEEVTCRLPRKKAE